MLFSRFLRNRDGNVAILFAMLLVPIIGVVGMAMDYGRASAMRTEMQAALDATALMLAKEARGLNASQLVLKGNAYFQSLFNSPQAKEVSISPSFTSVNGQYTVRVSGTGNLDTTFTKLLGHDRIDIGSSAEVSWGVRRIELALALDNTGSMQSSNKMPELKKAVHSLLDTLQKAAGIADDVKVSIIPFDTTVHLGTAYRNESWFDWGNDARDWKDWRDGRGAKDAKAAWTGCITDRNQPYDVQDQPPDIAAARFVPEACGKLASLLPLTNDWAALRAKIDSMQPNGLTNVTIGLMWAWHALTANAPLAEASPSRHDLDKVIVLLTDGDNTQNRWSKSPATIDERTRLACDNVKSAGIHVHVVRVIDGNAALLRSCASNPSMYYDVQNATELNAVFSRIAQSLSSLRITK